MMTTERLGIIVMNRLKQTLIVVGIFCFTSLSLQAGEMAGEEKHIHEAESEESVNSMSEAGHDDHESEPEGRVEIPDDIAKLTGIKTRKAGPGALVRTLTSYGRLQTDPKLVSRITARFSGRVTDISVRLGDRVESGAVLATIESNDSLQPYILRAPISGTIVQRNINVGEIASSSTIFTIAGLEKLWAELKIFPSQRKFVDIGQMVQVNIDDKDYQGKIMSLLPSLEGAPYTIARVVVDNRRGMLVPGQLVAAKVVVDADEVSIAIDNRGLQVFEEQPVVFVREGEEYEARRLELGRSDDRVTEVLAGLKKGERYVVESSYLIKADLEKSGASHAH